jgi:hypothetical protein
VTPGIDAGLRFENGRTRWVRPGRPLFDPRGYEVAEVGEAAARQLIERHHYSHSFPSRLRSYALYHGPFVVGAVVLSGPMNTLTLTNPFPELEPFDESAELGRVLLLPGAAFNAASWFLSRVFELERRRGTLGLVAFSDPLERLTLSGEVVTPGHTGITYQALSAAWDGRSDARKLLLFPDATSIPARSFQKVVGYEKGADGVIKRLASAGLPRPPKTGDRSAWARAVRTSKLLRPIDHPGNHRYLFLLDPIIGLQRPPGPYPRRKVA